MTTDEFDRIQAMLEELEKQAEDPGTATGQSSHPTAKVDDNTQKSDVDPEEADATLKTELQDVGTDSTPPVTDANKTDEEDVLPPDTQGEDIKNIEVKEAAELQKRASEIIEELAQLDKQASENESLDEDQIAVSVIDAIIKQARHHADLVTAALEKAAEGIAEKEEEEEETPEEEPEEKEEETPEEEPEEEAPEEEPEEEIPEGVPESLDELINSVAAQAAGSATIPEPLETPVPEEVEDLTESVASDIVDELKDLPEEEALKELASALMELGIDPAELAAQAVSEEGVKAASAVHMYTKSGRFKFEATKNARERRIRDLFKNYIQELMQR